MVPNDANYSFLKKTREGSSFHQFKRDAKTETFPQDFSNYVDAYDGQTYYWKPGNFHVICDPQIARKILTSKDFSADRSLFFRSRMPHLDLSLIQDFFAVVTKMMVMSDGEDHRRRRGAASVGFEDHVLDKFHQKIESISAQLIEEYSNESQVDFYQIARQIPSTVLAELFCIPPADRAVFVARSLDMTSFSVEEAAMKTATACV